jgi:hypothetical protein
MLKSVLMSHVDSYRGYITLVFSIIGSAHSCAATHILFLNTTKAIAQHPKQVCRTFLVIEALMPSAPVQH